MIKYSPLNIQNLLGGVEKGIHIEEVTNASRTLLLNISTLEWEHSLLNFFGFRPSILPKLVSTSEVYGTVGYGPFVGIPIGGLVGDQQAALIGNKCLTQGEAKCTFGTGAFLLFNTGKEVVKNRHGLISTVCRVTFIVLLYLSFSYRLLISLDLAPTPFTLSKAVVSGMNNPLVLAPTFHNLVAVAGSAIKWLRDSMSIIQSAAEINTLAAKEEDTGGLYFVTAFSGLFAPYWDPAAAGLMIGISQYTNPSHIARAALEANAFQTKAIIESMKLDSGQDLKVLKVDGGMTNGDFTMSILADIGGFEVVRPEMREYVFVAL